MGLEDKKKSNKLSKCISCGQAIVWMKQQDGKYYPFRFGKPHNCRNPKFQNKSDNFREDYL